METKEKAVEIFSKYYSDWEKNKERNQSGYDYERTYVEMMQKVQQAILQNSVGEISPSKNVKKKFKPVQGK
jgi:cell fate (sporulation/competence/biofilm development) regulator YlbF (YheA/YmcA/DUF963 family)